MQSSVMWGVRVNMMERRPLVAVGRKATNQIHNTLFLTGLKLAAFRFLVLNFKCYVTQLCYRTELLSEMMCFFPVAFL